MAQGGISAAFKRTRSAIQQAPPSAKKPRTTKAQQEKEAQANALKNAHLQLDPTDSSLPEVERRLRAFDLAGKYGPCTGMTRLARWERAAKFKLDPPPDIKELLLGLKEDDPAKYCLWHNRI